MASTIYSKNNMSASDVKKMQNALISAGYDVGKSGADGVWGKDTSAALAAYKKATGGSNASGNTVGNETFKKLYGSSGSGGSSTKTPSKPAQNYLVKEGQTGSYADIANKAQAWMTGGTYTPGQTIDSNWWGAGGGKAGMYGNNNEYKGKAMTATDIAKAMEYADAYDQMIAQQQQEQLLAQQQEQYEAYLSQFENMDQYYQNILNQQEAQYAANQAAAQQRTQATVDSINANKEGINSDFEKAQKENYINRVLQQNQMEDYLAAMGYSGGMAESTMQGINSNYENNRQNALSERDSALREIDRLAAEAQATGNSDLAEIANNYYNAYVNTLQQQAQMNYQLAADRQQQANADREYELKVAQNKWNQQMYQDELAADQMSAQEKLKQQIAANDFDAFLNTYKGKYNKADTYREWIEKLKKQNDPYGYNQQKIAYLTQYLNNMNTKTRTQAMPATRETVVQNDGAGTSPSESILKMAQAYASGQVPYALGTGAVIGASGAEQALSYLESMIKKGAITESQARQIAANIGL